VEEVELKQENVLTHHNNIKLTLAFTVVASTLHCLHECMSRTASADEEWKKRKSGREERVVEKREERECYAYSYLLSQKMHQSILYNLKYKQDIDFVWRRD
jgi:hypothetical protein